MEFVKPGFLTPDKIHIRYIPSVRYLVVKSGLEAEARRAMHHLAFIGNIDRAARLRKTIPEIGNDFINKRQRSEAWFNNMERPF